MRRRLTQSERTIWAAGDQPGMTGVAAVRVSGSCTEDRLRDSVRRLCLRHPALRARIVRGELTDEEVAEPPVRSVGAGADWRRVVEAETLVPFSYATGPLTRFVLVPDQDHFHLLVICHHLITDGMGMLLVMRGVLEGLATAAVPPAALTAPSMDDLLRHGALRGDKPPKLPRNPRPGAGPVPSPAAGTQSLLAWALDPASTSAVMAACARENTTVHAALSAAFLHAFADLDTTTTVRLVETPVSLRPMLAEQVGEVYGLYMTNVTVALDLADRPGLWPAARRFKTELANRMNTDRIRADLVLARRVLRLIPTPLLRRIARKPRPREFDISISNFGRLPIPLEYGPHRIEGLHTSMTLSVPNHRLLTTVTVGDRLHFSYSTLDRQLAEQVRDLAMKYLLEAAGV